MSNAELAPITKASCLCALNLSLTRLMLALLASHTATGRSLVCRTAPCALWPTALCGPFRPSLRSLCGPACREQLGTSENSRARTPVFSRLSPVFATRCKVLNLRLFIGETGPSTANRPVWAWLRGVSAVVELWHRSQNPAKTLQTVAHTSSPGSDLGQTWQLAFPADQTSGKLSFYGER
jgi:hypothetical protein